MVIQRSPSCEYHEVGERIVIVDNNRRKYVIFSSSEKEFLSRIFATDVGEALPLDMFSSEENQKIQILQNMGMVILTESAVISKGRKWGRFATQKLYLSLNYPDFENLQRSLFEKRICIVGAGALGSSLSVKLSAMGVKDITCIDKDAVELDNLTRQLYYTSHQAECRTPKVEALGNFISNFYPETRFRGVQEYLTCERDAFSFIPDDIDILINTADSPRGIIDTWINEVAVCRHVSTIYSHHGSVGPFYIPEIRSACLRCLDSFLDCQSDGFFTAVRSSQKNTPNTKNALFVMGSLLPELVILQMLSSYFFGNEADWAKWNNRVFTYLQDEMSVSNFSFTAVGGCSCRRY